jgi:hypothetical protein
MRQYRFEATESTIESLRRLRGGWSGFTVTELGFVAHLEAGGAVRVQVEGADVEDLFEAFRIEAFVDPEPDPAVEMPGDFAAGGNDVVIFAGASWSESGGATPTPETIADGGLKEGQTMHFSGHPGQLPESADVVCLTTDALVVATGRGTGILVRTGLKPYSIDVVRDPETIAAFLRERGYE